MRLLTVAFLGGVVWAASLCAQQQPPVYHAETALMEVEVRVTARQGRPVDDLTKDDFTLTENGEPQEIATCEFIRVPGKAAAPPAVLPAPSRDVPTTAAPYFEPAFEQLRRSTLIYIASRVGREDRLIVHNAIKEFIEESLQPGVLISLEGAPFTSDKRTLLARVDAMLPRGFRASGGPGLMDPVIVEGEREIEYSEQFEELVSDLNDEFSTLAGGVTQRRAYYGLLTLYRYVDLIRALSVFPGRKIVVLFSRGFQIDEENLDVLNSFADEAMRGRVSFYVADARRLQALVPGGDASLRGDFRGLMGDPARRAFRNQIESFQDNQDGLYELAKLTGGRAVLNTNDLGQIFEAVNESICGYYLLSYYPRDKEQRGDLRRIRVTVSRPGVRVSHRRGYYEQEEFLKMSQAQRDLELHQAVQFDTPFVDIPLTVGYEFFRGPYGVPVLAYSVGIHSDDIPLKKIKKGVAMDFSVVARATDPAGVNRPSVDEQRLHMVLEPGFREEIDSNPAAILHYTSQMTLLPGTYNWRVVLRDENSGKIGSYRATLEIPDFRGQSAPSTLLLTGRAAEIPTATASETPPGALDAGGIRFYPDSAHVFRRGDSIFMLYDLYNVPAGQLATPPSAKLALYVDKKPVDRLPVRGYEVIPEPERRRLRYTAWLDTTELEPGDYILLALLPPRDETEAPMIYRKFKLIAAASLEGR